ncbi:MAG: hypothetical protein WC716_01385 [Chitinophagaceae bacterium]|jgi:hypothetical protein
MKAPKALPPLANWQDFETLCKKLYGEIWNCREIKKNGRAGHDQHGVDVYGIPDWETTGYYGIQCKGKDLYTHKQFTEKEIIQEIAKAQNFIPALKKFFLVTTAVKSTAIEQFVRLKNIENKEKGLFEIHVVFWEEIVEYIFEYKNVYNWYVNSNNFYANSSVEVTFENGLTEMVMTPKFKKNKTTYKIKTENDKAIEKLAKDFSERLKLPAALQVATKLSNLYKQQQYYTTIQINESYCAFCILIKNTGNETIEDYKFTYKVEGDFQDVARTDEVYGTFPLINPKVRPVYNHFLDEKTKIGFLDANSKTLVPEDEFVSNTLFLKPGVIKSELLIKWRLLSRNFNATGDLKVNVRPEIDTCHDVIFVENSTDERIIESELIESLVIKEDKT